MFVTGFCPGDRCLPGSQNGLMAPVVFLIVLPFRSLLNFHVAFKEIHMIFNTNLYH